MFVKRARPRPSTRTREVDDDGPPSSSAASPASIPDDEAVGSVMERKKAQQKKKLAGKSSRLSFGGDDEASDTTPFKQKKSLLSQALKASASSSAPSSPGPSAGQSYSRDYLEELKASTPHAPPRDRSSQSSELSQAAREKYGDMIVEDSSAGIPDAAAIAAAKSRRAQGAAARKAGVESMSIGEDYISLGKEPHPESRLMREEDEGDDGDEDLAEYTGANDRLYLGKEANRAAARRMRSEMGELIDEREAESESDEETREWEDTIVARAGHVVESKKEKPKTQGYIPKPIPNARPVPSLIASETKISQRLEQLSVSKIEAESSLENATKDLVLLEEQERDLRKQVEEVEGKREWVEEFSGWAELLGTFLEEKYPKLEDIEKDSDHFLREKNGMVTSRRAEDDGDDLSLFLGIPRPVEGAEKSSTLDSSSANSDYRRVRRMAREDRRARRIGVLASAATQADEGFSTDSDLEPEVVDDYTASQHDLERRVHALLEDVKAEDFRYPDRGLAVRFADWRKRYPEDYEGAFGGLALVQAWEFWARGEMVGWDPLRDDRHIENFTWFTALYNYSRPQSQGDDDDMDLDELGPDGDLASEMVNKAVVPLLIRVLGAGAYNPYSTPQTRRAVDLVDVVAELTGKESKKYQSLIKALLGVFQSHIFSLASAVATSGGPTATPPPPYDPSSRSAMERYVRRRMKLLRNLLLWRRVAPTEVSDLVARVVSVVIRPILVRTWEGGGQEMAKKVLEMVGQHLSPNLVSFLQNGAK